MLRRPGDAPATQKQRIGLERVTDRLDVHTLVDAMDALSYHLVFSICLAQMLWFRNVNRLTLAQSTISTDWLTYQLDV